MVDGVSEMGCHACTRDVDCSDDKNNEGDVVLDNELNQDFKHALNDKDPKFLLNKHDKTKDWQIH